MLKSVIWSRLLFFGWVVFFFFQNYIYSKNLFIWSVAPVVFISRLTAVVGLTAELVATSCILDIWDIIQAFDHEKSSSVSQLI